MPRIWGARSLTPLYPEKTDLTEPIGEVWLTGVDCKVATGPFAGKTLGDAWREMPADWRGTRFARPVDFPILIKFIFPNDKLSIQVHPDDAYAAAHEQAAGGRGKTEMWHVISAEHGASLLLGLKPGVTRESFVKALDAHTLEALFQRHAVKTGDTYFVPAGTPHTIGSGMVICEVQEYSDLTYRVYDFGRVDASGKPRELHIEKALEVIDFGGAVPRAFRPECPMDEKGSAYVEYLAGCRHFAVEKWDIEGWAAETTNSAQFELLTISQGGGAIRSNGIDFDYSAGETWFLPSSLGEYIVSPNATVFRTYVPEIEHFEQVFVNKGYPEEIRRQFIFP